MLKGPEKGVSLAKTAKNVLDAAKSALQFGKDTLHFFIKIFQLASSKNRPLVSQLIAQEEKHITNLSRLINELEGAPQKSKFEW